MFLFTDFLPTIFQTLSKVLAFPAETFLLCFFGRNMLATNYMPKLYTGCQHFCRGLSTGYPQVINMLCTGLSTGYQHGYQRFVHMLCTSFHNGVHL